MEIADQVAIVTGSGSGLGRAMALGLAHEGGSVLVVEVRKPEGERVVEEIHYRIQRKRGTIIQTGDNKFKN